MALTDPVNVQAGEQRRKLLLTRLQQQMAAKAAAGGRGLAAAGSRLQGTGRPFNNAVDLRPGAAPKFQLPFELPNGRVRPVGYDPTPQDNGQSPIGTPVPLGPPLGGSGGDTVASAAPPPSLAPGSLVNLFDPSGFNSDTSLSTAAPAASATPGAGVGGGRAPGFVQNPLLANSLASPAPDPYQVMMARLNQLREARLQAATGGF